MDNEIEQKEEEKSEKTQETDGDTKEGDQQKKTSILEQANAAAERLEGLLKRQEQAVLAHEHLMAQQMLGGRSDAGVRAGKPEKESDQEFADKLQKGEISMKEMLKGIK